MLRASRFIFLSRLLKFHLTWVVSLLAISCTNIAHDQGWNPVDVRFHCDRIFAVKNLREGKQLFFTDSGGGMTPYVFRSTFDAWKSGAPRFVKFSEESGHYVLANTIIPKTVKIGFYPDRNDLTDLKIVDCKSENRNELCFMKNIVKDGFIGADWYAEKVWRLDYINKTVAYSLKKQKLENPESISFKVVDGKRVTHFPTMSVEIDGKKYYMLFDTGATSNFSTTAQAILGLEEQFCSSSFMRSSLFDALKKKNPQWRVVKKGDLFSGGSDLLQVPFLKVGRYKVGPIWFVRKKDSTYDSFSKKYVDRKIDGAIGGNVFKYFTVTIDYINEQVQFQK